MDRRGAAKIGTALLAALTACAGCAGSPEGGDAHNPWSGEGIEGDSGAKNDAEEAVGKAADAIAGGYGAAEDTGVVGLAIRNEKGEVIRTCSGALVAPNLVLTAQHCIAETTEFVHCGESAFGPSAPGERILVTPSASMWSAETVWYEGDRVSVPPGDSYVCGRDLAVVHLREPIWDAETLSPRLSHDPVEEEPYSAVGFGDDEAGQAGVRRRRDALRVHCVGDSCGGSGSVDGREWRGEDGICAGDSGGPALDEDGRIIGVTSRGPAGCANAVYGGLPAWGAWLQAEGVRAAEKGDYPLPDWTDPSVASYAAGLTADEWASCSAAPGPARGLGGAGIGLAVLGIGFAVRARKRR